MSNFVFMAEWPSLQGPAREAEGLIHSNPRGACFYARYALERTVYWARRHDASAPLAQGR